MFVAVPSNLLGPASPAPPPSDSAFLSVANLFQAMGEIKAAPASSPIDAVIVNEAFARHCSASGVEALRRIDPSLRIFVLANPSKLTPNGSDSADWRSRGFDDVLPWPARMEDLRSLLQDDAPFASAPSRGLTTQAKNDVDAAPSMALPPITSPLSPAPFPPLVIELDDDEIDDDDDAAAALQQRAAAPATTSSRAVPSSAPWPAPVSPAPASSATPSPAPTSPPPPFLPAPTLLPAAPTPPAPPLGQPPLQTVQQDEALGDTDLIQAIIAGPDRIGPVAVQLIKQQTGWTDVTFHSADGVEAPGPIHQGAASSGEPTRERQTQPRRAEVAVAIAPSADAMAVAPCFGTLSTSQATAAQVQPWAQWLAQWLLLDRNYHRYRLESLRDDLTTAWNRRFFTSFLRDAIAAAAKVRRPVTLMVFDIDNFKTYNDQFGHEAGDDVLRETVRLLNSVIRQGDRVCRIGGDEFAVIFADPEGPREPGSTHPETVEAIAARFQDQVCKMRFPKLGKEAPGTLSISAGLATYPWDGHDPDTLLRHADQLALQSKRSGKNAITFGPGNPDTRHEA
jgi:diguanylate cyclase (GGDEF)-like protein